VILLDTHVLLWLDSGQRRLGAVAQRAVDDARSAAMLWISVVTFWEVALHVRKGRVELALPPDQCRLDILATEVGEIELDGAMAIDAATLPDFHPDPADRMIVATARAAGATLVTADEQILAWPRPLARLDARR
jgi:PIN domain nuclease of toxin-antitoxin system